MTQDGISLNGTQTTSERPDVDLYSFDPAAHILKAQSSKLKVGTMRIFYQLELLLSKQKNS